MKLKMFYMILLLLILTSSGTGFGRKKSFNCRKENEQILSKIIHYNPITDQNATTDHYYDCDATEFSIVQKIPYLGACSASDTTEINFSSACVRCGICLAIAKKVCLRLSPICPLCPPFIFKNYIYLIKTKFHSSCIVRILIKVYA